MYVLYVHVSEYTKIYAIPIDTELKDWKIVFYRDSQ